MQETVIETKLTQEQYNLLIHLLRKQQNVDNTTTNAAHFACIFSCLATKSSSWVKDNGSSDHICLDISLFDSYIYLVGEPHFIIITNGKQIKV